MKQVALAGVYMSQQGDLRDRSTESGFWECGQGALAGAGRPRGAVEGVGAGVAWRVRLAFVHGHLG